MSHLWLILVLVVILSSPVFAMDSDLPCQYQVKVLENVTSEQVVANDGTVLENFIETKNLVYKSGGNPCWFLFEIHNHAHVPVRVNVLYWLNYSNSTGNYLRQETYYGANIPAHGFKQIAKYYDDVINCQLLVDSIMYKIHETNNITLRSTRKEVTVYECKPCCSGDCLNDGVSCTKSCECGSAICHNVCVQTCPEGFGNCSNMCVPASVKRNNEPYNCEFECASGKGKNGQCLECWTDAHCTKGICNNELGICVEYYNGIFKCNLKGEGYVPCSEIKTCVLPSSKENGGGYACETECSSGYGRGGVCKMHPIQRSISLCIYGIVFLVIVYGLGFIWKSYESKKLRDDLIAQKDAQEEQVRLQEEKVRLIEEELQKKEETVKADARVTEHKKRELEKQKKIREEQKEVEDELQRRIEKIKTSRETLNLNDKEYKVFPRTGGLVHTYYAKKDIYLPNKEWFDKQFPGRDWGSFEVHHIDTDKLNNDVSNLAVIPREVHQKSLNHVLIPMGDREAGLKELKRLRIKQPHIKELGQEEEA